MRKIGMLILCWMLFPSLAFSESGLLVETGHRVATINGYTRADVTRTLSSEVGGRVLDVNYDVGDAIGRKPYVSVDPTFIRFQEETARESLKKLQVALARLESKEKYLEKEFQRIEKLHQGDRATEVRRDASEQEWIQSRMEKDSLLSELRAMEIRIRELGERESRHRVFAPEGWVLVERRVDPGEIIAPNQPLGRISDFQHLVVPLCVSEEELSSLQNMGEAFEATIGQLPARVRINWVNPEFNEQTRKRCIELGVVEFSGKKMGGLGFHLNVQVAAGGLRVPKEAVVSRYANPRVTPEATGEPLNVLVLGESDGFLLIADHPKLSPGMVLKPGQTETPKP